MTAGSIGKLETSFRRKLGRLRKRLGLAYRANLSRSELSSFVEGKSIAIVGNARSLADSSFGTTIDSHDLVIRMNAAPMPSAVSHGERADILATSIVIDRARFAELAPKLIWWMTPAPMALPRWMTHSSGFWIYPAPCHAGLSAQIRGRPTTGLMAIDVLRQLPCASVALYGFDFFQSFSLSNDKSAAPAVHDFDGERRFVSDLIARDDRFKLITS